MPRIKAKQLQPGVEGQVVKTVSGVPTWSDAASEAEANKVNRVQMIEPGMEANGIGGLPDFD
jgi:hypothetical protein